MKRKLENARRIVNEPGESVEFQSVALAAQSPSTLSKV
jgi:hypothetical protein